jgi:tetratricopeptide (TPR) repeat protein
MLCRSILIRSAAALAGCGIGPQLRDYHVDNKAVELTEVPFYPQDAYQGAPAALAEMLGAVGVQVSPEELLPQVYDAKTDDSPQHALHLAAAHYGRMPYVLKSQTLDLDLVRTVQSGHPVLVLLREGVLPRRWHYAVVVGVDPASSSFVLRSGLQRRRVMGYSELLFAWKDSGYWAMLVLPPGELPEPAVQQEWLDNAALIEQTSGPAGAAVQAYAAAKIRWPDSAPAWFGLGHANAVAGNLRAATGAYLNAIALQPDNSAAHAALAQVLLDRHCADQAEDEINRALTLQQDPRLRDGYQQTLAQVQDHHGPSVVCPLE